MPRHLRLAAAVAALLLAAPAALWAEGIEIREAYARTAYPGAPTAAAFIVIDNTDGPADRLIDVRSPVAGLVQLHAHLDGGDGIMQMRHVPEGFALPEGGSIMMDRGGAHVMLMGVTESLTPGDIVPITLVFESGEELTLDVPVMTDAEVAEQGLGQMGHGAMHGTAPAGN